MWSSCAARGKIEFAAVRVAPDARPSATGSAAPFFAERLQRRALPEWIDLDTAVALARSRGATNEDFDEILAGRFKWHRIDVTGRLEFAPIERVRENFPARTAELNVMRSWRKSQHVKEFLARATSVECLPRNRLRVTIYWGLAARSLHSDTCILCDVHVFWPQVAAELEASGFAAKSTPVRDRGEDRIAIDDKSVQDKNSKTSRVGRPPVYDTKPDVRALLEKARSKKGDDWLLNETTLVDLRKLVTDPPEWLGGAEARIAKLPRETGLNKWIKEYRNERRAATHR
jgi:hypothetical protein